MVNKARPKRFLSPKSPQQRYKDTKNVLYAVVAIGEKPNKPPAWAIEVCKAYQKVWEIGHTDIAATKQVILPAQPTSDDLALAKVVEMCADNPMMSPYQAICKIVPNDARSEANILRLSRKFEAEGIDVEGNYGEVERVYPRLDDAIGKRYGSDFYLKNKQADTEPSSDTNPPLTTVKPTAT